MSAGVPEWVESHPACADLWQSGPVVSLFGEVVSISAYVLLDDDATQREVRDLKTRLAMEQFAFVSTSGRFDFGMKKVVPAPP